MATESYFFQHDYNARHDIKTKCLIKKFGATGYGVYWMMIEMLHENSESIIHFDDLTMFDLASDCKITVEELRIILDECVDNLKLFKRLEIGITCERVLKNKMHRHDLRLKRSHAGRAGGLSRADSQALAKQNVANDDFAKQVLSKNDEIDVLLEQNVANPSKGKESKLKESKLKESKVEEIKESKKKIPPTVEEVISYFKENKYSEQAARKAHEYYRVADWHDSQGNKVISWKQKMQSVWFKPENEEQIARKPYIPTEKDQW